MAGGVGVGVGVAIFFLMLSSCLSLRDAAQPISLAHGTSKALRLVDPRIALLLLLHIIFRVEPWLTGMELLHYAPICFTSLALFVEGSFGIRLLAVGIGQSSYVRGLCTGLLHVAVIVV